MTNEEMVKRIQSASEEDKKNLVNKLISGNLNFVKMIASKFQGLAETDDLIQEGSLGLWESIERYDPDKGASFLNYASYWIKQRIRRFINDNNVVHIPEYQRALIVKYERLLEEHEKASTNALTDRQICLFLGISGKDLKQLRKDAEMLKIKSLDSPVSTEDSEVSLYDSIPDSNDFIQGVEDDIQNEELASVLWQIVDSLEPLQSKVIHERYQNQKEVKEIACELGIESAEVCRSLNNARIRLRNKQNRDKLRPYLTNERAYSEGIKSVGVRSFNQSWTSATERAVLREELYRRHGLTYDFKL